MDLLIFEEEKRKGRYFLNLEYSNGRVILVAVDEKGDKLPGGRILTISRGGIVRALNVTDKLGLSLDDKGRIVDF